MTNVIVAKSQCETWPTRILKWEETFTMMVSTSNSFMSTKWETDSSQYRTLMETKAMRLLMMLMMKMTMQRDASTILITLMLLMLILKKILVRGLLRFRISKTWETWANRGSLEQMLCCRQTSHIKVELINSWDHLLEVLDRLILLQYMINHFLNFHSLEKT